MRIGRAGQSVHDDETATGSMVQIAAPRPNHAVARLTLRILLTITGWMAGFVGAVLGAVLLIWLWRTYGSRR